MKIVILDAYTVNPGDLSWEALEKLGELTVYDRTAPDDVVDRCRGAEIVLTNKVFLDSETLNQLPRLQYIGVLATGYNVVDLDAAKKQNITITNIPAYSTDSVAQMVWAHILNITNRADYYANENRKGRWAASEDFCYTDHALHELSGKQIGIVGLGNTGLATARIAAAFGMKVAVFTSKDNNRIEEINESLGKGAIRKMELDDLFATSDIVSLHCPLNDQTKDLVNAERLSTMKPSAILINTGRGPLVNEKDLAEALNTGTIAGFGADVLVNEPADPDNPLISARNSYITPHIAWATVEARKRLIDTCTQNIKAYIKGNAINVVNKE